MEIVFRKRTNQDFINLQNILQNIKDIELNEDNDNISFYFKQLDFFTLKKLAKENNCKILNEFVEKVDKIHSYTPQSGKRVYNFNEDRKVKDKKDKVKTRLGYTYFTKEFSKKNNELKREQYDKIICGDSLSIKNVP